MPIRASMGKIQGIKLLSFDPDMLHYVLRTDPLSKAYAQRLGREKRDIARRLAPVGEIAGGTLRDSINYAVLDSEQGWEMLLYASAPYAIFVEYGTSRGSPMQPFLRPALYSLTRL